MRTDFDLANYEAMADVISRALADALEAIDADLAIAARVAPLGHAHHAVLSAIELAAEMGIALPAEQLDTMESSMRLPEFPDQGSWDTIDDIEAVRRAALSAV